MDETFFSGELKLVLDKMAKLLLEFPALALSSDYFVLSILELEDCYAYKVLVELLNLDTIKKIYSAYYESLNARALKVVKPNRALNYTIEFRNAIDKAKIEAEKLNNDKINSVHVLLALLNDSAPEEKLKKVFVSAGATYDKILETWSHINIEESKEETQTSNAIANIENMLGKGNPKQKIQARIINLGDDGDFMKSMLTGMGMMGQEQKKKSVIESNCTNLNELVKIGKIDKIVGRDKELDNIITVLGRRKKNNIIIVGDEGVGKTALCEGLAYNIVHGDVPCFLMGKQIFSLNLASMMSGTQFRGLLEEKMLGLINELKTNPNYILYIDDIQAAFADKKNSDVDFGTILSSALVDGSIQVIGSCSFKGYKNVFDTNTTLARKFQKLVIDEPSIEETKNIIQSVKPAYEKYYDVRYTDEAIDACVKLAKRYIPERHLPDSAIDLFDEAGSRLSIRIHDNDETYFLRKRLYEIDAVCEDLKKDEKFDEADAKKAEQGLVAKDLNDKLNELTVNNFNNPRSIVADDIYDLISQKTGIPISKLTVDDKHKLAAINDVLKKSIVGQDEAIDTVCQAIKRNRIGLNNKKTMANLMLIGGTGLGKTLMAKMLAKEIFGDEKYLVRFDMSEYEDKTSVNKLIGSSAGYIGYENGGLLTETIKNKKYCVLLLDEFEKASPEVYNIFLQVFDEGFLTDSTGMKIDFKNVIVILTSNVGAKTSSDFEHGIGFGNEDNSKKIFDKELKQKFSPEFLNRLDDIIYFNKLTDDNIKDITRLELNKLNDKVKEIGHSISYDDSVVNYIFEKAHEESKYGARPIIRIIQKDIENLITDALMVNDYENHNFIITVTDNKITLS